MGHKQQSTATHTLMDPNTRTNNFALLCFVIPLIFKPLKNTLQCLDDQNPQRFQGLFNSFWHLHIRDQALHLLHVGARLSSSTTVYTMTNHASTSMFCTNYVAHIVLRHYCALKCACAAQCIIMLLVPAGTLPGALAVRICFDYCRPSDAFATLLCLAV